jgi:hypothetical protein
MYLPPVIGKRRDESRRGRPRARATTAAVTEKFGVTLLGLGQK